MPFLKVDPARSALLVIDVQTSLVPFIYESERTVDRTAFLIRMARLLDIPVFVTEQNPEKMGRTDPRLLGYLEDLPTFSKMEFGANRCAECMAALRDSGRTQAILAGVETHICVNQTARGLLGAGYEVWVCPDAVSARSNDRHKLGMEQIRDSGAMPAHTEAVAYEWLGTASDPKFREALAIVKAHP